MPSHIDEAARRLAAGGAALALLGVALGAFGAHGLEGRLSPADLGTFETGVRYQMYHALGLLGVAWLADRTLSSLVVRGGGLLVAGTVVFSGTLYLLVLTGVSWLGAVTPVGGVMQLAGWLLVLLGSLRKPRRQRVSADLR